MPWNEPGNNNNDPWGNKKGQGPPDLDKFFADLFKKFRGLLFNKGGPSPKTTWKPSLNHSAGLVFSIVAAILVITWFVSGLFIVNPAEEAVVLRFGKFANELQPGLHWIARFIETKYTLDVQKIYSFSLEGDFLTKSSDQSDLPSAVQVDMSKQGADVLDQSKNLVNVELNVQYRISNLRNYLFNLVDPDETIKAVASGALSDRVGQMKLDEVLTTGRETLSSGVLERIKQILASYQSGLEVITVTLRKVQAPDQVRAAFNDVNRADQDKATYIQQAQAYASKVVPIAQGNAARILAEATGYQQKVVLAAKANVARYQALLKVYLSAPQITEERMYLDTMQTVFQNTTKILVDFNSANNMIYLPLEQLLAKTAEANADTTDHVGPKFPSLSSVQNELANGSTQNTNGVEDNKNDAN